ncbi:type II and III secretion system protein [candidate division KSB1 bacterium]|nr:type II and III secretion system protein [candidate division KSB1 bacterium]
MKARTWMIVFLGIVLVARFASGQSRYKYTLPKEVARSQAAPDEIVSMTKTMPFNQAIDILSIFNKKFLGKIIIDPEGRTSPIGIDIIQEHWMEAFERILKANELWYEEFTNYIQIIPLSAINGGGSKEDGKISILSREVVISAVFFEADDSQLRSMGLSWDFLGGEMFDLGARQTVAEGRPSYFDVELDPMLDFGDLLLFFRALESDQIGEIVASPQITVRSEQQGRIQVGSDIAVTMQDFAGNSVTKFFSTGSIIQVTPEVIKHDSIDFIHLELKIERSNTASGSVGLEIKKSEAQTDILLLDGEETMIGGLYVNEETKSREGVPVLKDLPWWCFGLRYFFGYDTKSTIRKELVILLRAELLPTLQERMATKKRRMNKQHPTLLEQRMKFKKQMEFYQKQGNALE